MIQNYPKFSFVNTISTATLAASSAGTDFGVDNLKKNGRPWYGWESTDTSNAWITANRSDVASDVLYLNNPNFTSATLEGRATENGSVIASIPLTIGWSPYAWRYQLGLWIGTFAYQYVKLVIPSQTPVDGATYFHLGGWWLGASRVPPQHYLFSVEKLTNKPLTAPSLDFGGTTPVKRGKPWVSINVERLPRTNTRYPGYNDALKGWAEMDALLWQASKMLILMSPDDTTDAYIVTTGDDSVQWTRPSPRRASSRMTLTESVAP